MKRVALAGAAAIAIVQIVKARQRHAAWRAHALASDASGRTLDEVRQRLPAQSATAVTMLSDNGEAWVARWRLIESARERIDFSTFILGGDCFGLALMGALLRKQEAGVRVRVLVDTFGFRFGARVPLGVPPLKALRAAGADVRLYNVLSWKHLGILAQHKSLLPLFACDHEKMILVDEDAAICGGRNISPDYFAHPDDDARCFSDRDVLLRGTDCVRALRAALERERGAPATHAMRTRRLNLAHRRFLLAAADMMDRWLAAAPFSEEVLAQLDASVSVRADLAVEIYRELCVLAPPDDDDDDAANLRLACSFARHPRTRGGIHAPPLTVNAADVSVLDSTSVVAGEDHRINRALLHLLSAARESVIVESPYLILAERALLALEGAARRGVQVTIITNGPTSTDNMPAEAFFLASWPRLLARVPTLRLFVHTGTHNAHGKTAVIDDRVAIVGSYNLDVISAALNGELCVVLSGEEAVRAVAAPIRERLAAGGSDLVEYRIDRRALTDGRIVERTGPSDHVPWQQRVSLAVLSRIVALCEFIPGIGRP